MNIMSKVTIIVSKTFRKIITIIILKNVKRGFSKKAVLDKIKVITGIKKETLSMKMRRKLKKKIMRALMNKIIKKKS